MKKVKCLMIKTDDERCFFTHKDNYPQLVEFARTCGAEISVVKVQNVKVLELSELAKRICTQDKQTLPKYETIEVKLPKCEIKVTRNRKKLLTQASMITTYVKKALVDQKVVSIKDLATKFSEFKLSQTALCNHLSRAKKDLKKQGYNVKKVGRGQYQVTWHKKDK